MNTHWAITRTVIDQRHVDLRRDAAERRQGVRSLTRRESAPGRLRNRILRPRITHSPIAA